MSPEERHAHESRAERALRRGELGVALDEFRALAAAFPDDPALAARLAQLEANVSPLEIRPPAPVSSEPSGVSSSPMHEAEALAAKGDFAGAIALYRHLLDARPDLELVKERLAELFQLAQARTPPRHSVSREQVLEHLLSRIASRRKG